MKKFLTVFLTAALVLSLTACGDSNPAPNATGNNSSLSGNEESVLINEGLENSEYRYDEYNDHIEIIEYLLDEDKVEIPAEIDGKPVTVIR